MVLKALSRLLMWEGNALWVLIISAVLGGRVVGDAPAQGAGPDGRWRRVRRQPAGVLVGRGA